MHIDIHAHFVPRDCFDVVDSAGRRYGPNISTNEKGQDTQFVDGKKTGGVSRKFWDLETRIKDMDAQGVDIQLLSVLPRLSYYDLEIEASLWFSRRVNDGIARAVKECPTRFQGLATVPLQDPAKALAELDRAINKLGLRGLQILANINGCYLDSPDLDPFYKEMETLGVPMFIHPTISQAGQSGTERLKGYHLINLIGNPLDTTIAAAHLIFSGVLDRFPRLKFCLAHGGGQVPYLRGRWEHGYEVRPECKVIIKRPPSYYIPLLYFDTITHFVPALEYLVSSVGADNVMMGTDYPADMADPQPAWTVQSLVNVSQADKQKILGDNAARLFRL